MTFDQRVTDLKEQTDAYLEGYAAGVAATTEAASRELGGFAERIEEAGRVHPQPEHAEYVQAVEEERDRARDTAVRLEQELAETSRLLIEKNDDLVRGTLYAMQRQVKHTLTEAGQIAITRAIDRVAQNLGVTL